MTDASSSLVTLERDALQALVDGDQIEAVLGLVAGAVSRLASPAAIAFMRLEESGARLPDHVADALASIRVAPSGPPPGVAVFANAPAAGSLATVEPAVAIVESPAQRDILRRLGVEQGQGFLFRRAVAADDLATAVHALIATNSVRGDRWWHPKPPAPSSEGCRS